MRVSYRRRRKKLEVLTEMKVEKGCKNCHTKNPHVLQFHHRKGTVKLFTISVGAGLRAWEDVLEETKKCDVLCANCHIVHHAHMRTQRASFRLTGKIPEGTNKVIRKRRRINAAVYTCSGCTSSRTFETGLEPLPPCYFCQQSTWQRVVQ